MLKHAHVCKVETMKTAAQQTSQEREEGCSDSFGNKAHLSTNCFLLLHKHPSVSEGVVDRNRVTTHNFLVWNAPSVANS